MTSLLDKVLAKIDTMQEQSLDRLFDLLSIASISTDSAYDQECHRAASWLVTELQSLGFTASLEPTSGKPMVMAHWKPLHTCPVATVLFYGHYDVQPPDPLDLWEIPPFKPTIRTSREGRTQIVARGASDDKGQLMTFIEACRVWLESTGSLPIEVKILIEGEEENGSPTIIDFLKQHKEALTADIVLICDTIMWQPGIPAITTRLRGNMAEEIVVTAAKHDVHSGFYGGPTVNPIHILVRILADLHDDQGRIQLPGFYDHVTEITPEISQQWTTFNCEEDALLHSIGLSTSIGEQGYSLLEQLWTRPSCSVNGIYGGYQGQGTKTIIPCQAGAKLSFRLVPDQDPPTIRNSLHHFIKRRIPDDCTVHFQSHSLSPGVIIDTTHHAFRKAQTALFDEFNTEAIFIGCGATIPIVGAFKRLLNMESLLIGFALPDDCMHAPNEKYDQESFHHGIRCWSRILHALSNP